MLLANKLHKVKEISIFGDIKPPPNSLHLILHYYEVRLLGTNISSPQHFSKNICLPKYFNVDLQDWRGICH